MKNNVLKYTSIYSISIIILIISFLLNIVLGSTYISLKDVVKYIFSNDTTNSIYTVLWEIRIPRAITALMVGSTLSASGALIKSVLKNPLADTGLLGIQSGATLTSIIIILILPQFYHLIPISSFIGGFAIYIFLVVLSFKNGLKPIRLILTGVAINGLMGSLIGLVSIYNSDKIQNALNWLNGSLAGVTMRDAKTLLFYGIIGLIVAFFLINKCNLLLLDDITVKTLGENLSVTRFVIATVSVYLTSISVSFVGIVGFVGLIIPHIGYLIVGKNYKHLLPFSIIIGATFVLLSDILMKILFSPMEIPIGIVISFISSPFFIYLLKKQI